MEKISNYWTEAGVRGAWVQNAIVAVLYYGAGVLGLSMAFTAVQVSPVWPPTGFALAVIYICGFRLWPGIALGAFLANASVDGSILTALGIATGNTLEAVTGVWMLRRLVGFEASLSRVRDVLGFLIFAVLLSTMVSATVGVVSLCLGNLHPWSKFSDLWRLWWWGDGMGNLIVAPLLLTWYLRPWERWGRREMIDMVVLALLILVMGLFLFRSDWSIAKMFPPAVLVFPLTILVALRLGPAEVSLSTFVLATLAIIEAVGNSAEVTVGGLEERIISLQIFMGTVAIVGLLLAASDAERRTNELALRRSEGRLVDLAEDLRCQAHERTALAELRTAQLRAMAVELTQVVNIERRRLSQLLHDDLQQLLVAAKFGVSRITNRPQDRETILKTSQQVQDLLDECIHASRTLSHELTPPGLLDRKLSEALTWLAKQMKQKHGLEVAVTVTGEPGTLSEEIANILFQSVRELLLNTVKHANTNHARMNMACNGRGVTIEVADEGRGFDADRLSFVESTGLASVRDRINLIGGQLEIDSQPGKGSRFVLSVDWEAGLDRKGNVFRASQSHGT